MPHDTEGKGKRDCKTCAWLDVEPNADGRIVVRRHYVFRCLAPIPELPPLPYSVVSHHKFPDWPPEKRMVGVSGGENCPTYKKRGRP